MPLSSGQTLAHYEILEPIGKGGMGEVYRARDTKLERDVAIKVLPDELAADQERVARFDREAKLLASLNHPNIASIHGFEESDGVKALVLELVEGPTLAEKIQQGPIPVDEAIAIAKQIAEALEAGHESGVIHRDLKPANIKLKDDGTVKVLDYGLAKALEGDTPGAPDSELSQSPTLTRRGTQVGVILGTAAYMSPEQAKGKRVGVRTDVFAFGAVIFEMLAGRKAFPGEDVSETLAAVIKSEPDWSALPGRTPPRLSELLQRCLRKDPKRRLHSVADARIELEELESSDADEPTTAARRHPGGAFAAGIVAATLVAASIHWANWDEAPPGKVRRVSIQVPALDRVYFNVAAPVLSPNGEHVAYIAQRNGSRRLFIRPLERYQAIEVEGTEGVEYSPFFSPDSQWLGFYVRDEVKKVPVVGGLPSTVAEIAFYRGASWGPDGDIIVASEAGLSRISENGAVSAVGRPGEGDQEFFWPRVLPGGTGALVTETVAGQVRVTAVELATGERSDWSEDGINPHYAGSGHVVFARGDRLLAAPFDLDTLEGTGPAVSVLEDLSPAGAYRGQFSLTEDGTLLYVPATVRDTRLARLVWVDRNGSVENLSDSRRPFIPMPTLSPNGRYLAVALASSSGLGGSGLGGSEIWTLDIERDALSRLAGSNGAFHTRPYWSPDGRKLIYRDEGRIAVRAADGTGDVTFLEGMSGAAPTSLSSDGRLLVFRRTHRDTGRRDIGVVALDGTGEPELRLASESFNEHSGVLSPDDRFLAYVSDESGEEQVYVRDFPSLTGRTLISTDGGDEPRWSSSGTELFYRNGERMMVVRIEATEPELRVSSPEVLFEGSFQRGRALYGNPGVNYDVAPDGRFVMIQEEESESQEDSLHLVLNWTEELKRLVPTEN